MNFDVSRLRRPDQIIGGSAIAFFIFLFFFHWFGGSSHTPLGSTSGGENGWHTFSNSRWIWLITIIVALVAVAVASGALSLNSPVQLSVLVTGLAALSTLLILYRIIHHPHAAESGSIGGIHYSASYGIKIGIWLGLIASAALTYGGYLAMQSEGTSLSDVRDQASGALSNLSAQGSGSGTGSATPASTTSTPVHDPAPSEPAPPPPVPPAESAAPPIPPPPSEPPAADPPAS
jgi:hypothetical protein